jgi:hypothetical protein
MSEIEIVENFEKFKKILLKVSDRRDSIQSFLEKYEDRIATAPGSDKNNRHAGQPGGLVKRSLTTLTTARDLCKMDAFADKNLSLDSIIVVSLLHDIGRIGDNTGDYYLPQTSSWHIERGNLYTYNPNIRRMTHPHRGLYLLQSEGISLTQDEWIAIATQTGSGEENKFYTGLDIALASLLQTSVRIVSMLDYCGPENN